MSTDDLGAFLRARRGQVKPEDVGVVSYGSRRVNGLRREEVSMLAGVSVDYYTRLEQGRERSPSAQVLNAIAGALVLEADARGHVFRLAGLAPAAPPKSTPERVDPSLAAMLGSWTDTPGLILNRQLDILACNDLARALYSDFERQDNLVRMTFLELASTTFFADWPRASETCVANLRLALGFPGSEVSARALVNEAYAASSDFRRLWSNPDVRGKTHDAKEFHHSEVGDLVLEYHAFDVRSSPGQQLVIYQAVNGSPSAERLRLLGSLRATMNQTVRGPATQ